MTFTLRDFHKTLNRIFNKQQKPETVIYKHCNNNNTHVNIKVRLRHINKFPKKVSEYFIYGYEYVGICGLCRRVVGHSLSNWY